jgi:hypothetical protein
MPETPDIIATIEASASDYLRKSHKLPSSVRLTREQYKSYREELKRGRRPIIRFREKDIVIGVRLL